MGRLLLALSFLLIVGGPAVVALTSDLEPGALVFCGGVVALGFYSLTYSQDKAAAWVMISIGVLAAITEILRLFLLG